MKNAVFLFQRGCALILFWSIFSYQTLWAQGRIGYTESQIKAEFKNQVFKSGLTDNNKRYIYFDTSKFSVAYYFGEDKLCSYCRVIPFNNQTINEFVEVYNKEFFIISDTDWKYYTEKGVYYVTLVFVKDGAYFEFYKKD